MAAGKRVSAILLIAAGLACMAFFGFLLGMADCGPDCQARGERAPIYLFIGFGLTLVVLGATLRGGTMQAVGNGFLAGGAIALSGLLIVLVMEAGRGPMVWVCLAIAIGALAIGGWLRFWRPR